MRALREIMQEIALLGLWRSKFFESAAFYGETAMRVLHGLDRFSEDLDFSLLKPMSDFDIAKYLGALQKELEEVLEQQSIQLNQIAELQAELAAVKSTAEAELMKQVKLQTHLKEENLNLQEDLNRAYKQYKHEVREI